MNIQSLTFSQNADTSEAWYLDGFKPGNINLIVGKNATGKTRTLNVIKALANLVSGDQKLVFKSGSFEIDFSDHQNVRYSLQYSDAKVTKEQLYIDGELLLDRGDGGKGKIFARELNEFMSFQTPENELACVARRDSIQHPFFESLYLWGKACRHYYFGSALGKDHFALFIKKEKKEDLNFKETDKVTAFLKRGLAEYGQKFKKLVIDDMEKLGYNLTDIGTSNIKGIIVENIPTENIEALYVSEVGLKSTTSQIEISQGMFRALSLIIQINLSLLSSAPSCIIIDDIGEGLDYERSTALIKLLIEKVKNSSIQLIMSTNDRFVMNNVPLEYWSVISRVNNTTKIYNYQNSKEIFDDFKYTGLTNFDFLSTEFYLKGLTEE